MEIWTAFVIGFLGSFHCVGMCGPIALALPTGFRSRTSLLISRLLYNIGRVVTYTALGALSGFIGKTIIMAGFQQTLSIALGIVILLGVLIPTKIGRKLLPVGLTQRVFGKVRSYWGRLFSHNGLLALFVIGILNGFLPCGFVYLGLAGAASTGAVDSAMLYMVMFGLGTVPIMLVTSLVGKVLSLSVRQFINRLLPVGAVILAVILIMRGMSLGIPYISPKINQHIHSTTEPACH